MQVDIVSPKDDSPFPKLAARRRAEEHLVRVTASERRQLERWVRSRTQRHRTVVRSRIVLLATRGMTVAKIATQVQVAPATVRLWCRRFQEGSVAALERDARGRGRPAGMSRDLALAVLRAMQHGSHTRRSVRRLAAFAGYQRHDGLADLEAIRTEWDVFAAGDRVGSREVNF